MPAPHLSKVLAENKTIKWKHFIPLENNSSKINRCEHKAHSPADVHFGVFLIQVAELQSCAFAQLCFFLCPCVSDILNLCNQITLEVILLKGVAALNMLHLNSCDLLYIGSFCGSYNLKKHITCNISHSEFQQFQTFMLLKQRKQKQNNVAIPFNPVILQ